MRACEITELAGPDSLRMGEVPEPPDSHLDTPGEGVLIEVGSVGLSFPDVLQTHGTYQIRPQLPYVPGGELAGEVVSSTDERFVPGQRVVAMTTGGALAERVVAPPGLTFPLHPDLSVDQGAALIVNYHTALFALRFRGRVKAGEAVLVHGAAGGLGSASLQVARALGATAIAVVSSEEKGEAARSAGADHVLRSDGDWSAAAREIGARGVDAVVDPVGGDRVLDSLRSLRPGGRLLVVGFTAGSIPEVKVNRLLLKNLEVVGAGLGAWLGDEPLLSAELAAEVDRMTDRRFVRPLLGEVLPFERAAEGLRLLEDRRAIGKVIVRGPRS